MFRSRFFLFRLVVISMALLVDPQIFLGCGPWLPGIIYTHTLHPDFPLDRFARGELGILLPGYARSYLVAAYRHLKGVGVDADERLELVRLWRARLLIDREAQESVKIDGWSDQRRKIAGAGDPPKIDYYYIARNDNYYYSFINCQTDAFETAGQTLRARVQQSGESSPSVIAWVQAQDQVFAACSGGKNIPSPAPAGASPLERADRAYQIAAANFYARNFDEAGRLFGEIAADQASPWQQTAALLTARSLIRKATVEKGSEEAATAALTQAQERLKRILDDSALKSVHESARRLLGFVDYRLDPERRVRELAQAVLRKSSGKTIRQDVIDYTWLLDQYEGEDRKVTAPASARQDDLTDWLFTFQTRSDEALNHSLQRWAETSSSWWLIAALAKIEVKHPQAAALLEAAAAVPPGSPPFATAAYHWLRLTIDAGRLEAARDKLDRLLAPGTPLPVSACNQLLVMRTRLARTPEEFFKFAQRGPASVTYNGDGQELPIEETETDLDADLKPFVKGRVSFGEDAVKAMNEALPLALIKNAALDAALPAHLRRQLAIAGWTRAVLLDDDETARTLAPVLLALLPVTKKPLDAYLAAGNATERKDAALYLILKFPGLRPHADAGLARLTPLERADNYRDNWWCNYRGSVTHVKPEPAQPAFLSAEQQSAAAAERRKLEALEIGPNDLCLRAVEWAKRNPADPRVPEALHRAVTATRLGCRNKQTRQYSKLAFDTLHKQYPTSSWAKQTRYYFGEE